MEKKILYFDMDGVLADFMSGVRTFPKWMQEEYADKLDNLPHLFIKMNPMDGAIEAVNTLKEKYDVYILSTVPWGNETGASDKINWLKNYFGDTFKKKVFFTHHKDKVKGDFLIDDNTKNGASEFEGDLILFGKEPFENWSKVVEYLMSK